MKRLFIAIDIPESARVCLYESVAWMGEYKTSVKVVAPENYHITLKFLGGTLDEKVPAIKKALESEVPSLLVGEVALKKWGVFPEKGRSQVFWIGIEPVEALKPAAERLEGLMRNLGFAEEAHPFHGHVTLARVGNSAMPAAFMERWKALPPITPPIVFRANRVTLYESRTLPSGPVYQPLASVPLG